MKILFTGGGTLGPVTPLLAIAETWKKQDSSLECVWVGTKRGPEREFVEQDHIRFFSIVVTRFPRYISKEFFLLPFRLLIAMIQSMFILLRERPDVIASAGGYTAVPIILVSRLFGIPSWIHQQDVVPLLTNKLTSPFASLITVAWEETEGAFPKKKTKRIGNPVRSFLHHGSVDRARTQFTLDQIKPTVLVFGGGTGAFWLNEVMKEIWMSLSDVANVIHVTGKGKSPTHLSCRDRHYHVAEYLTTEMADAFAVADVVVCRAGLGTITELAALKKAAIIIPIPHSTQERNARAVQSGAIVLSQNHTHAQDLLEEIRLLLVDETRRKELGERISELLPTDVSSQLIGLIRSIVKTSK